MPQSNKEYMFMTTMPQQQVSDLSQTVKDLQWFPRVKVIMREK